MLYAQLNLLNYVNKKQKKRKLKKKKICDRLKCMRQLCPPAHNFYSYCISITLTLSHISGHPLNEPRMWKQQIQTNPDIFVCLYHLPAQLQQKIAQYTLASLCPTFGWRAIILIPFFSKCLCSICIKLEGSAAMTTTAMVQANSCDKKLSSGCNQAYSWTWPGSFCLSTN